MRSFSLALLAFLTACSGQNNNSSPQENSSINGSTAPVSIQDIQGTWLAIEDTLAVIDIKDDRCAFKYTGTATDSLDNYRITLTEVLPGNPELKSNFIILTNGSDTLRYEITGISPDTLSMMYLERGNIHTYKKQK